MRPRYCGKAPSRCYKWCKIGCRKEAERREVRDKSVKLGICSKVRALFDSGASLQAPSGIPFHPTHLSSLCKSIPQATARVQRCLHNAFDGEGNAEKFTL